MVSLGILAVRPSSVPKAFYFSVSLTGTGNCEEEYSPCNSGNDIERFWHRLEKKGSIRIGSGDSSRNQYIVA